MKDRSFADFLIGALACVSMLGVYALVNATGVPPALAIERRKADPARFELPKRRRRKRTVEDECRHCSGHGTCAQCSPEPCRVCRGNGVQPRDPSLIPRLDALWGAA